MIIDELIRYLRVRSRGLKPPRYNVNIHERD